MKKLLLALVAINLCISAKNKDSFSREYGCEGEGVECIFLFGRTSDDDKFTPRELPEAFPIVTTAISKALDFPSIGQEEVIGFIPSQGQLKGQKIGIVFRSRKATPEEENKVNMKDLNVVDIFYQIPEIGIGKQTWPRKGGSKLVYGDMPENIKGTYTITPDGMFEIHYDEIEVDRTPKYYFGRIG